MTKYLFTWITRNVPTRQYVPLNENKIPLKHMLTLFTKTEFLCSLWLARLLEKITINFEINSVTYVVI